MVCFRLFEMRLCAHTAHCLGTCIDPLHLPCMSVFLRLAVDMLVYFSVQYPVAEKYCRYGAMLAAICQLFAHVGQAVICVENGESDSYPLSTVHCTPPTRLP